MQYRQSSGENITGENWILRNVWDSRAGVVEAQGVRKKLEEGKKRHEFQADHGFRKWFKTRCEIAGSKPINVEILMGHSIGISDSYLRPTEDELLEDYLKAIPFPTIGEEKILQHQLEELEEKNRKVSYGILGRRIDLHNTNIENKDAIGALADVDE